MSSSTIIEREAQASHVEVSEDALIVHLMDGRVISVPLAWYPRLNHATDKERHNYQLVGRGYGIHWPDLDEDLSVRGMLRGNPSYESQESIQRWLAKRK